MNLSPEPLDGPLQEGRFKRRRNSLEIMSEMLEAAEQGSRKTTIMFKANLSYALLVQYLSILKANEFLETADDGKTFFPTRKGQNFVKEFREFRELHDSYTQKALVVNRLIKQ